MCIGLTGSDNNPFGSVQYRAYGLWDISKCKKIKIQRYSSNDANPYGFSNSLPSGGTFTVGTHGYFASTPNEKVKELSTNGYHYLYVSTRTDWSSGYVTVEAIE